MTDSLPFLLVHGKALLACVSLAVGLVVLGVFFRLIRPSVEQTSSAVVRALLCTLIVAAMGAFATSKLSKRWERACVDGFLETPRLSNTHACALMMVTPGDHRSALDDAVSGMGAAPVHDATWTNQLVALGLFNRSCSRLISRLSDEERFEEIVGPASGCADREDRYLALFRLGRYEEAALTPTYGDYLQLKLPAYLATQRWAEAAASIESAARDDGEDQSAYTRHRNARIRCVADLVRSYAGDQTAIERIRVATTTFEGGACDEVLDEVEPGRRRARNYFGALPELADVIRRHTLARAIDGGVTRSRDIGLARWFLLDDGPRNMNNEDLDLAALRALLDGDAKRAHELATDPRLAEEIALFSASIVPPITESSTFRARLRARVAMKEEPERPDEDGEFGKLAREYAAALRVAQHGDARPLLATWPAQRGWEDADIMAVLPNVTIGRKQLLERLDRPSPSAYTTTRFATWDLLLEIYARAIQRRGLLMVAGLTEQAARWDAIARRHDKVLADRRVLAPLVLLSW